MALIDKLNKIVSKYETLSQRLLDPNAMSSQDFAKTAKERSDLESIVGLANEYKLTLKNIDESDQILKDSTADQDFKAIAQEEFDSNKAKLEQLENSIKIALLPRDEADAKNAILEVRAGTGGEEAALFASTLFRMYQKYAENHGWKFEVMSISSTGLDGFKEASALITGKNVFSKLKFESGVHRVQRVPETESSGRIHTSAATVAVLPEAEEIDIELNDADLRIDVYRAGGAGGQHVNTTDSAVRITHIPTGVVVTQQDEKSQHKNKAKALKILRSRIYEAERSKRDAELSSMRKGQVGSGDRSERIRTYNFPQSRVTDHRINLTSHQFDKILNGGELDEFIDALTAQDQADKLASETE